MIKRIMLIIAIIYSFIGCEENVVYKSGFNEIPALYCVINADSSNQYAMLTNNYSEKDEAGNNYIKDANIQITVNNESVEFKDSSTTKNNVETDFYYVNGFKPKLGSEIEIKAELTDGRSLSSSLAIPKFSLFVFEKSFVTIPSSQDPSRLYVGWTLRNSSDNLSFLTRLTINYSVNKNGIETKHDYPIPIEYVISNNNKLPVYPQAARTSFQVYPQSIISTAFSEISVGDTNKSSYTILNANFEVFIMEENLTNYSASIESFNNSYSVKVYEPQISNINGGLGVFGAYVKRSMDVFVEPEFIESFGYNYLGR